MLVVQSLKSAEVGVVGQKPEPLTVADEVSGMAQRKLIG